MLKKFAALLLALCLALTCSLGALAEGDDSAAAEAAEITLEDVATLSVYSFPWMDENGGYTTLHGIGDTFSGDYYLNNPQNLEKFADLTYQQLFDALDQAGITYEFSFDLFCSNDNVISTENEWHYDNKVGEPVLTIHVTTTGDGIVWGMPIATFSDGQDSVSKVYDPSRLAFVRENPLSEEVADLVDTFARLLYNYGPGSAFVDLPVEPKSYIGTVGEQIEVKTVQVDETYWPWEHEKSLYELVEEAGYSWDDIEVSWRVFPDGVATITGQEALADKYFFSKINIDLVAPGYFLVTPILTYKGEYIGFDSPWAFKVEAAEEEEPAPSYDILEGEHQAVDGSADLTVRANIDFAKFTGVLVDGNVVPAKDYDVWEGSTYVRLHADYLKTLSKGNHTLTILATDGKAETPFVLVGQNTQAAPAEPATSAPTSPKTGDSAPVLQWVLAATLLLALGGKAYSAKKQK